VRVADGSADVAVRDVVVRGLQRRAEGREVRVVHNRRVRGDRGRPIRVREDRSDISPDLGVSVANLGVFGRLEVVEQVTYVTGVVVHELGREQRCSWAGGHARVGGPVPVVQRQLRVNLAQQRLEAVDDHPVPRDEARTPVDVQRPSGGDLGGWVVRWRLQAPETVIPTCSATSLQVRPWSRSSRIFCVEAG
jgi:hypothetical protein